MTVLQSSTGKTTNGTIFFFVPILLLEGKTGFLIPTWLKKVFRFFWQFPHSMYIQLQVVLMGQCHHHGLKKS